MVKEIESAIRNALQGVNVDSIDIYDDTVEVTIEGDWKHDHARANYFMAELGCPYYGERVTEEDGSDFYTSIHVYKLKNAWRVQ